MIREVSHQSGDTVTPKLTSGKSMIRKSFKNPCPLKPRIVVKKIGRFCKRKNGFTERSPYVSRLSVQGMVLVNPFFAFY